MDYETAVAWDLLARIITGRDGPEADRGPERPEPAKELTAVSEPDTLAG
ncbi:hypothetical protein [Streptacidiphilus monticola]|jgi:hypothetical protein|uniref:Uncharacterized protein n=1 Tax=Streptacidiphilus monticola TaxID=2161674 RepID=A0ABW1G9V1_9ACTN